MKAATGLLLEEEMCKYILGISCYYHDSAAALLKDGKVVAAAEEERFTRKKHDTSFPINAIRYCLTSQNITIKQVNRIGFYEKPLLKFERILSQHLAMFPLSLKTFINSMPSQISQKLKIIKTLRKNLKYSGDVVFIRHHLAHAAGSFLVSPFEKAAILSIDGVGEWTTTTYGIGKGNKIELLKEIRFPHSLGLLYSTITAYLGFSVNNSEYKVMGLSAYGDMNRETNPYYKKLKQVIDIKSDGSYKLDLDYFIYHYKDRMPSKKLCALLGGPIAKPGCQIIQRHKDIAAAVQLIYEETLFKILEYLYIQTGCEDLVLTGGCALNSVANGKILKMSAFKNIWIHSNPSDGGTSIGAAVYIYHSILGYKREQLLDSAYLGPNYSRQEIRNFLMRRGVKYSEFKDRDQLIRETAELIHNNHVVGWFHGRMEWGPRALGNRSILANPCNPKAKELLNEKVKHREKFRPFAPVVCEDDYQRYFDCDQVPAPAYFMLTVYPIKVKWRNKIPSVTHVDGSGRLQLLRRDQNSLYYDLLKKFGELSDVPILINTSFNIRGEPIVCTPDDAYKCMMGTGIDCLVMGNYLIKRDDNPQDFWDSESVAID